MAYIKYKEITKYFYFYKELETETLPKYVTDYISDDEHILAAYTTHRDKGVFTDKKILLFDVTPFSATKQIHTLPLNKISTLSVLFSGREGQLIFHLDSGYPLTLKFVRLSPEAKTNLRLLYSKISKVLLGEELKDTEKKKSKKSEK